MTAEVLTLPVVYTPQRPVTRIERARERTTEAQCWLLSNTVMRLPVVLVRRSVLAQREVNAFELGRECERYLDRGGRR